MSDAASPALPGRAPNQPPCHWHALSSGARRSSPTDGLVHSTAPMAVELPEVASRQ